jgi:hypothetical protein
LGGNAKTTLVLCCSPHPFDGEQTLSTLRFGQKYCSLPQTFLLCAQSSFSRFFCLEPKQGQVAAQYRHRQPTAKQLRTAADHRNAQEVRAFPGLASFHRACVRAAVVLISRDVHVVSRELLAMKKYAEYLEEELRKLKGPNWKPSMPRPNFVRQLPRHPSVDPI